MGCCYAKGGEINATTVSNSISFWGFDVLLRNYFSYHVEWLIEGGTRTLSFLDFMKIFKLIESPDNIDFSLFIYLVAG